MNREDARRRAVYQLLHKEQHFSQAMHFGVGRFLLPMADRKDLISTNDHQTLFQNAEELLRLSEDILEQTVGEEGEQIGHCLGRTYLKKISVLTNAYRRYFLGLKKADCLLVAKTRNTEFMRHLVEPPVPRKRPDLTAFLHKPLEHYRDILKLLQTILHYTKVADDDYSALSRVVHELQVTYRDVMAGAGLMEPEAEGRPLLSMQDLESRLVFTRCKPFVLNSPGRQWIFGGDLSRVEGRAVRPFWALLFTDLLLFAKVSRDRVLFITEEPLSLLAVTQAFFNIRKRANEFRLLMDGGPEGTDSPAAGGCGPELPLSRNPKKGVRRRTISLRAPTAELKAVWQNLIQRQIIYLNTARGGTPASSPLDSPDQPTTLSVATLDSISLRRQTPQMQEAKSMKSLNNSQRHLDELIEHKCRQLGKSGASKGSALHLAQWMRGQLGGSTGPLTPDEEPEPEVWSPETLRRRSEQLQILGVGTLMPNRNESRCEEIELSDTERSNSRSTERSRSHSTSDSQVTVRSGGPEQPIAVCRKCHKTCLANNTLSPQTSNPTDNDMNTLEDDDNDLDDKWGPLMLMGLSALSSTVGLGRHLSSDPFSPTEVPMISVLPPTPDTMPRSSSFQWDDTDVSTNVPTGSGSCPPVDTVFPTIPEQTTLQDEDEESCDNEDQEPPYKSLTSASGLKRFGTLTSLEMLEGEEEQAAEDSSNSDEGDEWDSDTEDKPNESPEEQRDAPPQLEAVTQSLRGWTARAGSFVAEKMALFERLGEDSRAAAFLDRYLRPAAEPQLTHVLASSLPDPATTSSDDCETSAATSDDVWGTPTSGGDMDDISFPSPESAVASQQESPAVSPTSACAGDEETELMMDELLATPPLTTSTRGFPPRRRLEPLLEEEDTDISPSSTPVEQEETPSPEQGSGVGGAADISAVSSSVPTNRQSPGFFNRLRLCKNQGDPHKTKGNKLLGFLSNKKSEEDGSGVIGSKALFRIFGRHHVDDIPTSLPPQLTPCRTNERQLDKRFWRQLRRRRGEGNISSPAQIPA
ncbi:hypothetical protein R5R35_011321 [Gryllus longicercus]|uniref:DH domain-containing protein n=1 Tax=Gryllus longicercus TaxID=2509291 RepID=A0AAN9VX55_9ORTH